MRSSVIGGAALISVLGACAPAPDAESTSEEATEAVPISLWFFGDSAAAHARGFALEEHPCGASVTLTLTAIPPNDSLLEAEWVVEFDAAGRETGRWRMPVDSRVLGVRDSHLLVPLWERRGGGRPERVLAIRPSGQFAIEAYPQHPTQEPPHLTCPALPAFGASDYLGCHQLRDQHTGIPRRLAYQDVCT